MKANGARTHPLGGRIPAASAADCSSPNLVQRQATVYLHAQGLEAHDEVARTEPGARLSGQRGDLVRNARPDFAKRAVSDEAGHAFH